MARLAPGNHAAVIIVEKRRMLRSNQELRSVLQVLEEAWDVWRPFVERGHSTIKGAAYGR
jgi:hypothetical protein